MVLEAYNSSGKVANGDGAFVSMSTDYMDVPFSGGGTGTTVPSGQSVTGHNTRFVQVGDPFNAEFIGLGYSAGCGSPPSSGSNNGCTGTNSSRGVYNKAYVDGVLCNPSCNSAIYLFDAFQAISAGDQHSYQVQRNFFNGTPAYQVFVDGSQVGKNYTGWSMAQGHCKVDITGCDQHR